MIARKHAAGQFPGLPFVVSSRRRAFRRLSQGFDHAVTHFTGSLSRECHGDNGFGKLNRCE
jgi:hypothetical protein